MEQTVCCENKPRLCCERCPVHRPTGQRLCTEGSRRRKTDLCWKLLQNYVLPCLSRQASWGSQTIHAWQLHLLIIWVSPHLSLNWEGVVLSPSPFMSLRAVIWMSNVLNALKKVFHWQHGTSRNWAFYTSFVSLSSRYKLDVLVLPYVMLWKYVHFSFFCSCWM